MFAAFWNDADPVAPWTVRFVEIIDGLEATVARPLSAFGECFTQVVQAEFRHDVWLTPADLVAFAKTRSPYLVATPRGKQTLVRAIEQLIAETELARP